MRRRSESKLEAGTVSTQDDVHSLFEQDGFYLLPVYQCSVGAPQVNEFEAGLRFADFQVPGRYDARVVTIGQKVVFRSAAHLQDIFIDRVGTARQRAVDPDQMGNSRFLGLVGHGIFPRFADYSGGTRQSVKRVVGSE